MDDISVGSSPPPSLSRKRSAPDDESTTDRPLNLKGTQFLVPTAPNGIDNTSNGTSGFVRELSPTGSISTLSSIQDVSSVGKPDGLASSATSKSANGATPAKKRKLTPAEKAEQQRAKDMKAQEKAELKRVKDEEKRVKDEEKRRKAEEREGKKREKELEEERKNQEKLKKERSQMRLGMFFRGPTANASDNVKSRDSTPEVLPARRRSLSLETFDAARSQIVKNSPCKKESPQKAASTVREPPKGMPVVSDYHKYFLPYEPKPYTTLPERAVMAELECEAAQARFDAELHATPEQYDLGLCPAHVTLKEHFRAPRGGRRGRTTVRARTLIEQIQGSSQRPIDLTTDSQQVDPLQELANLQMRHLHFHEDVRPAYFGTATKLDDLSSLRKLARNAFARVRTDTDYDYDSEAEWDEPDPDDAEDLGNDEEDDESIGDEDEMDGFLDDENDELKARRRLVISDLEAHSSGLCWEDSNGSLMMPADASPCRAMKGLRLQFLLPDFEGASIDPFSTAYWPGGETAKSDNSLLRPPLKERSSNTASVKTDNGWPIVDTAKVQSGVKKGTKPGVQKTMNAEEFELFKAEIVGSLIGKQEMISKLKTSFPNLTAVLVKDTLSEQFAQVGKTKADKKWVYVGSA
ncbi:hypothetical protein AMS68_007244 [Peltaster fructicola]|uniref:Chromatin assembly factor 1 subunit A n=1 Tax=Peltaster fructicola TaxID=286661 RepID=A0A6H0Y3Y0_9PEZI|nr:hypothetical protein AMS68_007244 [Peltaster fructicola]